MEEIKSYEQLEEVVKKALGNKFEKMVFSQKYKNEIIVHLQNLTKDSFYEDMAECRYSLMESLSEEWLDIEVDYHLSEITISGPKIAAYAIMTTFEPFIIKSYKDDSYTSILIGDKNSTFQIWIDKNNETDTWEYNQYSFLLTDSKDVVAREMQNNDNIFNSINNLL